MVIPKPLREELGIDGPAEVELTSADGRLELTVPDEPAHVEEHDGFSVIVTDRPMEPMSVAETRAAIEHTRR